MLNFFRSLFTKHNSAKEAALRNGAVILDVRSPSEYKQGHVEGSKNVPVNEIRSKLEMIKKWNKPVITVCASGSRSAVAKTVLTSAGIEAYNGGSWINLQK